MSKKSLDKKEARKFIIEQRVTGKSDQEIYQDLSNLYYDKNEIALLLTGTVKAELKTKYRFYNNLLLFFIAITILLKLLIGIDLVFNIGEIWGIILLLLVPVFNIYFFYGISRYDAPVYRFCGILTMLGLVQSFRNAEHSIYFLIFIVLAISIIALCFYLDAKLFPRYRPKELKKNTTGDFIFD